MSIDPARVRELFDAAIDLDPLEVRAFLDQACAGDVALRDEVLSLLGFHDERELMEPSEAPTILGRGPQHRDGLSPPPDARVVDAAAAGAPGRPGADSRYAELEELGVGGSGRVTRVWDRRLRRVVARKQLWVDGPGQRAMLLQEARLLAWLDHPGAVPIYDVSDGVAPAYTMRLLDGETLGARLTSHGRLSVPEAMRILARVGETMANAHAKGVLHLDLKPENIMLLPYGQVCVLDWGVARFHDLDAYRAFLRASGEPESPDVAGYEGVAGTPSYMPVEQVVGDPLTPATDVFAFGTILYETLTGELPYRPSLSPLAVLAKQRGEITPLRSIRADVPERLEALCVRMLAPRPADRPATFAEVLTELDTLAYGGAVVTERVLATGEVLFREGDEGDEAYQILAGSVVVTVGGADLARRGAGDLVGELAVVSRAPRSATVTAVEPTRVAVITGEDIERELGAANPLIARMVRGLSERLRQEARRISEAP